MREQIAVLDGINGLGMSDPYAQDYSEFDGPREFTPVPGGGANRSGGSDWHPMTPTLPSSEGLASSLGMETVSGGGWAGRSYSPVPGGGANYQGGSNWHPLTPTMPSSEGLAGTLSMEEVPGYAGRSFTPVPGGGANYTGGSNWKTEFPTKISSQGLVGYRGRGLRGLGEISALERAAYCGVLTAIRLTGRAMSKQQMAGMVLLAMTQMPASVVRNTKTVSYYAALQTASRSMPLASARGIAQRAAQHCGG